MLWLFKDIKKILSKWCTLVLMSCLAPKKRNLVLLIGKDNGAFVESVKYLYLYLHRINESGIRYYFLTERKSVYETLKQNGLPAVCHPTFLSVYLLLRAKVVIVCSSGWMRKSKYYLSFRAKKIQLWHGISLKKMELAHLQIAEYISSLKGKFDNAIRGKFINHDLVISPSEFYTKNVFSKAFRAKDFLESGYPRNDIFFNDHDNELIFLGSDKTTISKINELRASGHKIILYAPTFRDTGGNAITDGALNLDALSLFAEKHRVIFVFKYHSVANDVCDQGRYTNILEYDNSRDIQPLLRLSDILITDYSSVYMDYLLLDKPIIFFNYDYEKYTQKDRELFFDYDWITPGPKCCSQDSLEKTLTDYIVEQKDDFSVRREEIRNLVFKYKDGNASERIWDFIKEKYIKA